MVSIFYLYHEIVREWQEVSKWCNQLLEIVGWNVQKFQTHWSERKKRVTVQRYYLSEKIRRQQTIKSNYISHRVIHFYGVIGGDKLTSTCKPEKGDKTITFVTTTIASGDTED